MVNLLPVYADLGSSTQNTGKAKLYTIFFKTAPSTDDTHLLPMSNDELIHQLKNDCSGVDFTVRDLSKSAKLENVLNEIEDLHSSVQLVPISKYKSIINEIDLLHVFGILIPRHIFIIRKIFF